jgi:adenine-specific DNA-methyltransferase
VRILDPGAGVGTLSAAVCQRALEQLHPRHVVFELWENDLRLHDGLQRTMAACRAVLKNDGHEMEFTVRTDDFVFEHAELSLFGSASVPSFDLGNDS